MIVLRCAVLGLGTRLGTFRIQVNENNLDLEEILLNGIDIPNGYLLPWKMEYAPVFEAMTKMIMDRGDLYKIGRGLVLLKEKVEYK